MSAVSLTLKVSRKKMTDLERIKYIEKTLGIKLNEVSLDNLFTENAFLATSEFWLYSLFGRLDPKFFYKGVRNYSIDQDKNVTGLALDFTNLLFLTSDFLQGFAHLQKLKLRSSKLADHKFIGKLKNLISLDLSLNNLSNADFLKDLQSLNSLDLNNNKLSNYDFLKDLQGLTSLDLRSNNLLNANFLKDLQALTSLALSDNNLSNYDFLKDLQSLNSLDLRFNKLSNADFLKDLQGLTSLDLSDNNLSNTDFLKDLQGLTSLDLSSNNLSNADFLKDLQSLTSLALSFNKLLNADFLKDLQALTSLDLSDNNLSNYDFLKNLQSLNSLVLRFNNLSNYDFLKDLQGLTSLDLSSNNLSNADFLKDLQGLTSLALSFNNLSNADFLKDLQSLNSLDLSSNNLSNYDFLKDLQGLTSLALSDNNLLNYDFLKDLQGLTSLDLRSNNLSNADFIRDLQSLTSLDLSFNKLLNADFLKDLQSLTSLALRSNNLSNADFLKDLQGLTSLDLRSNNLSNADFLKDLQGLTSLALSSNNLSNADFLKDLQGLTSLDLRENPLINPPKEVVEQGISAIRKYFEDKNEQGIDYVYEAKVLIVGETQTGKTTLFKKLLDNEYFPQKGSEEDVRSTVGVNIETWEFPYIADKEKTIKANLWDFGGQAIQYTLHQYFLTKKSFYIFLISNRVGDNEGIHRADYWFKVIALLGKDCPVLVILNEQNDSSVNSFNIEKYKERFGKELGKIEKLDVNFSVNDRKWNNLLDTIKEKISCLPHIGEETEEDKQTGNRNRKGLPKRWVEVREKLSELKDNYIKLSDYENICKDVGLYEELQNNENDKYLSQNVLLRLLHNLGVVINYEDAFLRNYLILNPTWLTKSLYMVMEDKVIKEEQSGKFTSRFLQKLWQDRKYSQTDYEILLNLMLKDNFEIAYKVLGKDDDYVIPMLLPEEPLIYEFDETNAVTLIVRFDFMPHGVFSRLVVQLNNFINVQMIDGQNKQVVWKKGMLLNTKDNSFAEVIESDDKEQTPKEIKIRVSGTDALENKKFLNLIVSHIHQINKDWFRDNLEFDELIPCICDNCGKIKNVEERQLHNAKTLRSYVQLREETVNCNKSADIGILEKVPIQKLLDGVYFEGHRRGEFGNQFNNSFYGTASIAQGDNPMAKQFLREMEN